MLIAFVTPVALVEAEEHQSCVYRQPRKCINWNPLRSVVAWQHRASPSWCWAGMRHLECQGRAGKADIEPVPTRESSRTNAVQNVTIAGRD
jgi:hypothetical protein